LNRFRIYIPEGLSVRSILILFSNDVLKITLPSGFLISASGFPENASRDIFINPLVGLGKIITPSRFPFIWSIETGGFTLILKFVEAAAPAVSVAVTLIFRVSMIAGMPAKVPAMVSKVNHAGKGIP
jgi:hypothetical protein